MPEKNGTRKNPEASAMEWGKMLAQFWEPLMPALRGMFDPLRFQSPTDPKGRMDEALASSAKAWQALFGSVSDPGGMDHFMKAAQVAPDIAFGLSQACLQTFGRFQEQVNTWISNRGAGHTGLDTQELDKAFIRQWTRTYEEELSRYFKIPQIGLTRFYQERALTAADKFNLLQTRMSEFMHLLYLPLEKSFNQLKEKVVEMAETGAVDEKSKTYYNIWIKLLEAQYMKLFQQPEYSAAMGQTLEALHEFSAARQAMVDDMLKIYAIPTQKELDELYKEIHLLKKRLRACEKKG